MADRAGPSGDNERIPAAYTYFGQVVPRQQDDLAGRAWRLRDARTDEVYERSGDDLRNGLFVALDPYGWHLFDLQPVGS